MQECSQIAVNNMGGFVFSFTVQYLDPNTGKWNTVNWHSGNYPIEQNQTSPDLGSLGVPANSIVTPLWPRCLGN